MPLVTTMPTNLFSTPGQAIKCGVLLGYTKNGQPFYVLMIGPFLFFCYLFSLSLSPTDVDGCTVCKDAFKVGDKLRRLPCKHLFHENCIIPWLKLVGLLFSTVLCIYNGPCLGLSCVVLSHSMIHVPPVATMSTQRKRRQLMMRRKLSLTIV